MRLSRILVLGLIPAACIAVGDRVARAESPTSSQAQRLVLVELYTSQGCDMCPEAERILGDLGESNPRVAAVAFHVDYFNEPWHDPFSDRLNSERQAAYNSIHTGPRHPDYGLYYTPMAMVDGVLHVNGRDRAGLQAAVRQALARRPQVAIAAELSPGGDRRSRELKVSVTSRSARVGGREILVCAVLRDDGVATRVGSGENANKTLVARYPARTTRFEIVKLEAQRASNLRFPFRIDPAWETDRLGVLVFAQDRKSGEVYQAAHLPWDTKGAGAASAKGGLPAGTRR